MTLLGQVRSSRPMGAKARYLVVGSINMGGSHSLRYGRRFAWVTFAWVAFAWVAFALTDFPVLLAPTVSAI